MSTEAIKENLKSIGGSIFEAKSAFTLWKGISYSRSTGVLPQALAEKYVDAQNNAPAFFTIAERSALIAFVLLSLHPVDTDTRSFSFFNIDKDKTNKFTEENKEVISSLKLVRNKVFAHKDSDVNERTQNSYTIPAIDQLEIFFENLAHFYNDFTRIYDSSSTDFDHAPDDMLHQMDHLFMNISRGENVRLKEIDIECMWEMDSNKISNTLSSKKKGNRTT
jgi:hypothetical protein